jgi:hypothetical protein
MMATLIEAANDLLRLKNNTLLGQPANLWSDSYGPVVTQIQTAALAADAPSQEWVGQNRSFIINSTGAARTLQYNGRSYVFANGSIYSCSPGEANLFLTESSNLGFPFATSTMAAWVVATGVNSFFFE